MTRRGATRRDVTLQRVPNGPGRKLRVVSRSENITGASPRDSPPLARTPRTEPAFRTLGLMGRSGSVADSIPRSSRSAVSRMEPDQKSGAGRLRDRVKTAPTANTAMATQVPVSGMGEVAVVSSTPLTGIAAMLPPERV